MHASKFAFYCLYGVWWKCSNVHLVNNMALTPRWRCGAEMVSLQKQASKVTFFEVSTPIKCHATKYQLAKHELDRGHDLPIQYSLHRRPLKSSDCAMKHTKCVVQCACAGTVLTRES